MKIKVTTSPKSEDLETLNAGIKSFNQEHLSDEVVFEPDTRFAVFARNDIGDVVGGIRANGYWNYCLVELLWIDRKHRGSGIGSRLMEVAEHFARGKGFGYMRTETVSFQARPFYEKHGYAVYGELPDYPKGHTTYCLMKAL